MTVRERLEKIRNKPRQEWDLSDYEYLQAYYADKLFNMKKNDENFFEYQDKLTQITIAVINYLNNRGQNGLAHEKRKGGDQLRAWSRETLYKTNLQKDVTETLL